MNFQSNTHRVLAASLPLSVLLLASSALAQSAREHKPAESRKLTLVEAEPADDGDARSEAIEIRIVNGEVSVKRNGKEIPKDRVQRHDDGRIVILDEQGGELRALKLPAGDAHSELFHRLYRAEDGQPLFGNQWQAADGPAPKVMIGVHMGEPGAPLVKHLSLAKGKTTMITGLFEGLPAEEAGLGEFDIIIAVDGQEPADPANVKKILAEKDAGDSVTLRIIQAGKQKDVKVRLQAFDAEKMRQAKLIGQEPEMQMFSGFDALKDHAIQLDGFNAEGLKDRVFIAPEMKNWQNWVQEVQPHIEALKPKVQELAPMLEHLAPTIEKYVAEALKQHGHLKGGGATPKVGEQEGGDRNIDARLDRLDQRMAELEKMLQRLIEREKQ